MSCRAAGWGISDCGHDEDVGIACSKPFRKLRVCSFVVIVYLLHYFYPLIRDLDVTV